MKFLVCIKQVVDTSKMEVDPGTGRLKRNNANSIMNPVDLNALEAALSLRDRRWNGYGDYHGTAAGGSRSSGRGCYGG